MAANWPEYDEVAQKPTEKHRYFRVLLTSKAPNGKQVMARDTGKTYAQAHASAYIKLSRKIRRNKT